MLITNECILTNVELFKKENSLDEYKICIYFSKQVLYQFLITYISNKKPPKLATVLLHFASRLLRGLDVTNRIAACSFCVIYADIAIWHCSPRLQCPDLQGYLTVEVARTMVSNFDCLCICTSDNVTSRLDMNPSDFCGSTSDQFLVAHFCPGIVVDYLLWEALLWVVLLVFYYCQHYYYFGWGIFTINVKLILKSPNLINVWFLQNKDNLWITPCFQMSVYLVPQNLITLFKGWGIHLHLRETHHYDPRAFSDMLYDDNSLMPGFLWLLAFVLNNTLILGIWCSTIPTSQDVFVPGPSFSISDSTWCHWIPLCHI